MEKLTVAGLLKKFLIFYMERELQCYGHKSPPLDQILSQINPVHTFIFLLKIHFNIILSLTSRSFIMLCLCSDFTIKIV